MTGPVVPGGGKSKTPDDDVRRWRFGRSVELPGLEAQADQEALDVAAF